MYLVLKAEYISKNNLTELQCEECFEYFSDYFDDDIFKVYRSHETLYFCNDYQCYANYITDKKVKYLVSPY